MSTSKASSPAPEPRIFGIRHHGPGSARSLRRALESLRPDVILLEGPSEATAVLPLAAHPEMQPPVALLLYVPKTPRRAVYYPFIALKPRHLSGRGYSAIPLSVLNPAEKVRRAPLVNRTAFLDNQCSGRSSVTRREPDRG
jgi:hypothetical protein